MKKFIVIVLISLSLFLLGCFKEKTETQERKEYVKNTKSEENLEIKNQIKKEIIENTNTGKNLGLIENNKTNLWVIYASTWSKNGTIVLEDTKIDAESNEKKMYILDKNKLIEWEINDIEKNYKNIVLSDKIIYYKNEKDLQDYINSWCWEYNNVPNCFNYSKENESLIEIKNISKREWRWFWSRKWDIYENWTLLIKDFPFWCWDWCQWPIYNKKNWIISVEEWRGDVCAWFNINTQYDLKTKKFSFNYNNFDWCFVENNRTSFWEWNNNVIDIYDYYLEENPTFNNYSIFSISKWNSQRNYIYNSDIKIETNEDFMNAWDNITYFLWWKEFNIDFNELEKSKEKMPILYWWWQENANFDYWVYLKKQWNNYTIHFDKISGLMNSEKIVKDIWIISCKSNFSKEYDNEYILKTKDIIWNYKYNISENLNNKCNIPYKINVYYEDWTKETWEYYLLFDY